MSNSTTVAHMGLYSEDKQLYMMREYCFVDPILCSMVFTGNNSPGKLTYLRYVHLELGECAVA